MQFFSTLPANPPPGKLIFDFVFALEEITLAVT
jgi:hypothetical protein